VRLDLNPTRAAQVLGVSLTGLTQQAVREAFRYAVRAAHPDTGGGAAAPSLASLREARNALLTYLEARGL